MLVSCILFREMKREGRTGREKRDISKHGWQDIAPWKGRMMSEEGE